VDSWAGGARVAGPGPTGRMPRPAQSPLVRLEQRRQGVLKIRGKTTRWEETVGNNSQIHRSFKGELKPA
jgi:hypothetical protein